MATAPRGQRRRPRPLNLSLNLNLNRSDRPYTDAASRPGSACQIPSMRTMVPVRVTTNAERPMKSSDVG
jgi:hypothetical protein